MTAQRIRRMVGKMILRVTPTVGLLVVWSGRLRRNVPTSAVARGSVVRMTWSAGRSVTVRQTLLCDAH